MSKDGLTDHELIMEVRTDVRWIKNHLGKTVTRREIYGVLGTLMTIGLGVLIAVT